jgi:hypothetical protein
MPDILINALIIVIVFAVWEFIKTKVKKFASTDYVTKQDFDEYKKECDKCQKSLPEKYVLYSRYKEDVNKAEQNHKEGLEGIWKKIDELLKLYYED